MLINIHKENLYDLIIVTDRNYGLYAGFATGILGLKVLVLEYFIIPTKKKPYIVEDKIWKEETKDDYLISVKKLNIEIIQINEFFYNYNNITNNLHITYNIKEKSYKVFSKNILYALSINHYLLPKTELKIIDNNISFEFNKNLYVLGEKAHYNKKIFKQDIYTGEGNLIAQIIYQKINNSQESISIHSTEVI
jgi:hypothetical protein